MGKYLIITEKPSVAREFAKALKENMTQQTGYLESNQYIITWCVGHLVTMSYPDVYDEKYKKWSLNTIPFVPEEHLVVLKYKNKRRYNNERYYENYQKYCYKRTHPRRKMRTQSNITLVYKNRRSDLS